MASKMKTEVKKEPGIEVKVEEDLNMKKEFEPEAKKLKREFKEEIKTEDGNEYFSSSNFPKTVAKLSFKLTSLFGTVKESIRKADEVEQDQRSDLYRGVQD